MHKKATIESRVLKYVKVDNNSGCWLWNGHKDVV
jgi:hypothetical protein